MDSSLHVWSRMRLGNFKLTFTNDCFDDYGTISMCKETVFFLYRQVAPMTIHGFDVAALVFGSLFPDS